VPNTIDVPSPEAREPRREPPDTTCTADIAECTCPDFSERDHANE